MNYCSLLSALLLCGTLSAGAATVNYVNNSSFENSGDARIPHYWGTQHWGLFDGVGAVDFARWQQQWRLDSTQAYDGRNSLRLSNDSQEKTIPNSRYLQSCQIPLPGKGPYVLSLYLKAASARTPVMLAIANGWGNVQKKQEVMVGTEWGRYELAFDLPQSIAVISVVLPRVGTVWVDAIQFEPGLKATPYSRSFLDRFQPETVTCPPPLSRIDEAAWATVPCRQLRHFAGGNIVAAPTTVQWLADAENLYFRFRFSQPDAAKLPTRSRPLDSLLWKPQDQVKDAFSDVGEIFLSPSPDGVPFYHLVFDSAGNRYDSRSGNANWDGEWSVKTHIGDREWTAEVKISWANFANDYTGRNEPWRLNVARENPFQHEVTALFPTYSGLPNRERFGYFNGIGQLSPVKVDTVALTPVDGQHVEAAVELINSAPVNRTVSLAVEVSADQQLPVRSAEREVSLSAGQCKIINIAGIKAAGTFAKVIATVREERRLVGRQNRSFAIRSPAAIRLFPDQSFYTDEKILDVTAPGAAKIVLKDGDRAVREWHGANVRLDLAALPAGEYVVAAGTEQRRLIKLPPFSGAVKIRYPEGVLQVDGRPFIPVAVYWERRAALTPETLQAIRAGGYNTVQFYIPDQPQETRELLKKVADAGLKAILEFRKRLDQSDINAATGVIKEFSRDPALLAWMVQDEPELRNGDHEAVSFPLCRAAKAADPYHPVYINYTSHRKFNQSIPGDICSVDLYPVPAMDLMALPELAEVMRLNDRPAWMFFQTCGNNYFFYREPTPAEFRYMLYASLMQGCRGFSCFAQLPRSAELRAEVKRDFEFITSHAAIIGAPTVAVDRRGEIWRVTQNVDGKQYILAFNPSARQVNSAGEIFAPFEFKIIPAVKP